MHDNMCTGDPGYCLAHITRFSINLYIIKSQK